MKGLAMPTMMLSWVLGGAVVFGGPAERWSCVDEQGVMRWQDDGSEVALFGVNYYTPFTADYEGIKLLGGDHRKAIERDVAHFVRLGLDAIRLHVFDRQISDQDGNLLANQHLDLFDYLVAECKRRGIYTVLTPIAWWQYHSDGKGFSCLYTKPEMVLSLQAREAQTSYLRQFMDHVNPYTKAAYKEEPAIVAIELINEPLYSPQTTLDQITEYIDALGGAVRATGAPQPIFYNGWQGTEEAVTRAKIEGCTFGWYPTGVLAGQSLRGNFLPAVDDYPRMRLPCLAKKAKIVYEFDAADLVSRCMYPAMARAFRSGGAQIATQFQYDPAALAHCNYGWQTHYLNLVYGPGKAVSFAIAAEAFRRIPRLARFGEYPENTEFGPVRIDYEKDLSLLATERLFYYSNRTDAEPPSPERLQHVMGCGSSPVVGYDGTGAYFLDKLADGLWRLEVYPDAVWVDDPHGAPSLAREVSRLVWTRRTMRVCLADLGPEYQARRIAPQAGEGLATCAHGAQKSEAETLKSSQDGAILVEPGVYVLARSGTPIPPDVDPQFYAPKPRARDVAVWWQSPKRWRVGHELPLRATVAAAEIEEVRFHGHPPGKEPIQLALSETEPYTYEGAVPAGSISSGLLLGRLEVRTPAGVHWLPEGASGTFAALKPFTVCRITDETPIPRFDRAATGGYACEASIAAGPSLCVRAAGFGAPPSCAGFRLPAHRPGRSGHNTICIRARAVEEATDRVELGLVQRDGKAYGLDVPLWSQWYDARVPVDRLHPLWATLPGRVDLTKLAEVSLVFGAWLYGDRRQEPHGFEIERVWLERIEPGWAIDVRSAEAPIELFVAGDARPRPQGQDDRSAAVVRGAAPGRHAVRVSTRGFGPEPSSISFRQNVPAQARRLEHELKACKALRMVARGTQAATDALEVVLLEADGAPWGTVVGLSTEWQEITVPLDRLRFFDHWAHPSGRGGPNDRFRPESVAAVNFCFGAWLFGESASQPHGVEIESASLVVGEP